MLLKVTLRPTKPNDDKALTTVDIVNL